VRYGLFDFVEGVEAMVSELESRGLEVAVITNGHHKVQRDKLEACNAYRIFHHIIVGGGELPPSTPSMHAHTFTEDDALFYPS
jgi:FMN phosphatase YigB (HAD superfamily)